MKFSGISWVHDDTGFFYSGYCAPASSKDASDFDAGTENDMSSGHRVMFHRVGTHYSEDILIYSDPKNVTYLFSVTVSSCGQYAILSIHNSCDPSNQVHIANLRNWDFKKTGLIFSPLFADFRGSFSYITNESNSFYFKTDYKAPKHKVVRIDIPKLPLQSQLLNEAPSIEGSVQSMRDIIKEHHKDVLQGVSVIATDKLVTSWLSDVIAKLDLHELRNGKKIKSIDLPGPGSITALSGDKKYDDFFFSFTSYTDPGTVYRYNTNPKKGDQMHVFFETEVPGYDKASFESKQVFYESKDGTKIPMIIICKKGKIFYEREDGELKASRGNSEGDDSVPPLPTILYGYGGFSISLTPGFAVSRMLWIERFGGCYAVANLR